MKKTAAGVGVLLVKLSPKLLTILFKLKATLITVFKSLFSFKTAGIAASLGMYTYLFTWQMGVALVAFIGIHEYGHLWAMHRCGLATRGMYFIPGFGAVAIADGRFKSAEDEAYIAIMGPVFGMFGFVIPALVTFTYTNNPLWAAVASFMTFINLVNLFPINPLDGGRIVKALAYSRRHVRALMISLGITVVTTILGGLCGMELLFLMALMGFWEIAQSFGIHGRIKTFLRSLTRLAVASFIAMLFLAVFAPYVAHTIIQHTYIFPRSEHRLDAVDAIMAVMVLCLIVILIVVDVRNLTSKAGRRLWWYPIMVCYEGWVGMRELIRLRKGHIKPIQNYGWMSAKQKLFYGFCFLGLIAVHAGLLIWLAKMPEASIGRELLN